MRHTVAFAFFLLVFLSSCALFQGPKPPPCPTHLPSNTLPLFMMLENDAGFLENDVVAACARWGESRCIYGGVADEEQTKAAPVSGIVIVSIDMPGVDADTDIWLGGADRCTIRASRISIPSDLDWNLRARYLTHEIGHSLGYDHSIAGDIECVMYPGPYYEFNVFGPKCIPGSR